MRVTFILLAIALNTILSCGSKSNTKNENITFSKTDLIEYSKSFIGVPHKMGGTDKNGMDCSGFVQICYKKFKIDLPHSANEQSKIGKKVTSKIDLKLGDLVFFENTYKTNKPITHSGIYIENRQFIHVSTKKGVIISDINDPYYWSERFVFGTRIE